MNTREIAVKLLRSYEENDSYVNLSLNNPLVSALSEEDRSFVTALLFTTVERRITLDYYISALAKRPVAEISPKALALLRIGLCQLLYMEGIPAYAAVSETVALAKGQGERGFVNGILRAAQRQRDALPLPPREKNLARFFSVAYSVPLPLSKYVLSLLGEGEAEALLRSFLSHPPLTLAVNTLRISRETFMELLREGGIEAEKTAYSPYGVKIFTPIPVAKLPGFSEGLFFVQDEASQLSSLALAPMPGARVIDVCAAPGGKSMLCGVQMQNEGEIVSLDLHESKLSLIRENAARLGLSVLCADAQDATAARAEYKGGFTHVMCDVPCSGLGVLWKKPDLRYRAMEGRDALPVLQAKILSESATYVAPGGTLVYSTCTLRAEENSAVVREFLTTHPEFSLVPFAFGDLSADAGMLTTYPHVHGMDGFFIAKLCRRAEK